MKEKIKKIIAFINQWKIISIILLIGFGLFYWYEVRPSRIYSFCNKEAQEKAIELMKTKVKISPKYKEFSEKGLFLKDDYESYYKKCLREKGIGK